MAKAVAPDVRSKIREIALALPRAREDGPASDDPREWDEDAGGLVTWNIAKGIKIFAAWDPDRGDLEFHSNDASLLDDPRFTRPKFTGQHSWVRLAMEGWSDWDRLAKLLAESHRVVHFG